MYSLIATMRSDQNSVDLPRRYIFVCKLLVGLAAKERDPKRSLLHDDTDVDLILNLVVARTLHRMPSPASPVDYAENHIVPDTKARLPNALLRLPPSGASRGPGARGLVPVAWAPENQWPERNGVHCLGRR